MRLGRYSAIMEISPMLGLSYRIFENFQHGFYVGNLKLVTESNEAAVSMACGDVILFSSFPDLLII